MAVSIVTFYITISNTNMIITAFSYNTCTAKISTSAISTTITRNAIVTLAIAIMMLFSYT